MTDALRPTVAGTVDMRMALEELERVTEQIRAVCLGQPELREAVTFSVWPEESDPDECGGILVRMDQAGIRMWWLGAERSDPEWDVSWTDLRHFAKATNAIEDQQGTLEDLLREIDGYRRDAYRYRNAVKAMRARYEKYIATLPAEVQRIEVAPTTGELSR